MTCRFQVSAYEHSTARQYLDTGMEINPGANLVIEASGTACFGLESDHCNGPDGHPAFNDTDLVGKFSGGDQFHIGSSFQLTMGGEGGRLYLGFNDTDYDNNRGYFDVTVMVDNTFTRICTP